jgi:hypothetical protein
VPDPGGGPAGGTGVAACPPTSVVRNPLPGKPIRLSDAVTVTRTAASVRCHDQRRQPWTRFLVTVAAHTKKINSSKTAIRHPHTQRRRKARRSSSNVTLNIPLTIT